MDVTLTLTTSALIIATFGSIVIYNCLIVNNTRNLILLRSRLHSIRDCQKYLYSSSIVLILFSVIDDYPVDHLLLAALSLFIILVSDLATSNIDNT